MPNMVMPMIGWMRSITGTASLRFIIIVRFTDSRVRIRVRACLLFSFILFSFVKSVWDDLYFADLDSWLVDSY